LRHQAVLHNYTAAYKLVSSLKEIISKSRADNSYPKYSDQFLLFCQRTADDTLRYLEKSGNPKTAKLDFDILISKLSAIRQGWELLHTFIKPVLDADSLKVPYSLIQFLSEHTGKLSVVKGTKIVIESNPELNYFQHRHTELIIAIKFLLILIGEPENLTERVKIKRLGFLGLPYSQSKSLFMNCLLYHEIGHFIAEEAGVFSTKIRKDTKGKLEPLFEEYTEWAGNIILVWMEELFADLVAVKLLGPAYTLAYMELYRSVIDLSSDQILEFDIDHPCAPLRFREQVKALKKDKWEQHIKLEQWERLKGVSRSKESAYKSSLILHINDPYMVKIWQGLIKFFCRPDIIKTVHDLADEFVEGRENPCEHFIKSAERIQECLEHGIVPSFAGKNGDMPHPTAIINGAMFFWLSGMDDLYQIVPSIHKEKVKDRVALEQRVEMWCMKAIEDWLIKRK